jgi:hypothetical protein
LYRVGSALRALAATNPQSRTGKNMTGNESLRRELDAATAILKPSEYPKRLAELKEKFQHSITVLSEGAEKMRRFNCFAYAYGVWSNDRYISLVDDTLNAAVMDLAFVMDEIERNEIVEFAADAAQPNDIVLYFAGDQLTHAGRVVAVACKGELTIHSKWGPTEVHVHALWEVPLAYGDRVRFFSPPNPEALLDRLEGAE